MKLSDNFSLIEFLRSDRAEREGGKVLESQRNPPPEIVAAIKYQVRVLWQPCREALGVGVTIGSGWRSPKLNIITPGASSTSQHVKGEAGDGSLSEDFLTDPKRQDDRETLDGLIQAVTGKPVRRDVNATFYLFAYMVLKRYNLDVDQIIHEYGTDGCPAWVHASASADSADRREVLIKRTGKGYVRLTTKQALLLGC